MPKELGTQGKPVDISAFHEQVLPLFSSILDIQRLAMEGGIKVSGMMALKKSFRG
jgi:hypothetical protein